MREKLVEHAKNPACSGCHRHMDPLGLALENFDAIGAYRTTENGLPIDASATIDGERFVGVSGLAALLVTDPRLGDCVARQLYRHGMGHLEEPGEEAAVQALQADFAANGHRFSSLVEAFVLSEAFRRVGEVDE